MITRVLAVGALLTAGMFTAMGSAAAAPPPADVHAARAAAAAPATVEALTDFFGDLRARDGAPAARATAVTVGHTVLPVYTLSPEFVSGAAGADPGKLAYLAVPAAANDGRTATLQVTREGDGAWTVGNMASGDLEFQLAGKLPAGAVLLREPQVNAWYARQGDRLTVIDPGGTDRTAGEVLTVADYQKAVGQRYADKQAGSGYAARGQAGGYGLGQRPIGDDNGVVPLLCLGGLGLIGVAAFGIRRSRRG
ncbi:hypothetical protein EV193_103182 [Herbihabitans rhizosphaerae]|uniref:Uncharacterized protein n=1 Tax=Herbihabitans rhizosphaerae TaxID=1872711 RepID=A0A4Q7KV37_9PSEU|nr:hypothetical protein [Herbihabitans rhizosphaerae]RZS40868.1 hypothetical protein EV193_103182 [Herbihabitans rhizosphaerae]